MLKITLEFNEHDVQELLDAANFTDAPSLQASELTRAQIKALKKELQDTADNFVEEITESSREACANDWLDKWGPKS